MNVNRKQFEELKANEAKTRKLPERIMELEEELRIAKTQLRQEFDDKVQRIIRYPLILLHQYTSVWWKISHFRHLDTPPPKVNWAAIYVAGGSPQSMYSYRIFHRYSN